MVIALCSCGGNDDMDSGNNCSDLINQEAQGSVKGFDFTNQGGTYTELSNGEYRCAIRTKQATGGSCLFPEFEPFSEELREVKILFGLKELKPQTITFSDIADAGGTLENTLNFNAIHYDSSTNSTYTDIELATCGSLEIVEVADSKIKGRIIAEGQKGSTINGNFTIELCEF